MENLVTPSERAQSLINPHSRSRAEGDSPQDKMILGLKILFGAPIPILMTLYVAGLVVSEPFLATIAGLICLLGALYILVDFFSQYREFNFFFNATDLPILGFFAACALSLPSGFSAVQSSALDLAWVPAYFLLSYVFLLFPGLNRLFQTFAVIVPLFCAFSLWQRFYGLRANLSFLPEHLAHAVSGIDTIGFFHNNAPFALAVGCFVSFATAALFVSTSRPRVFKAGLVFALTLAWLSLVLLHSNAVLVAVLSSVLVILLYCQRTYFFLLSALIALFVFVVPTRYTFNQSFTTWMEPGENITQEKRDISRAELQMFQDSIWLGIGYGPHQSQMPEYFKKLNIDRQSTKITSNNYFAILSSTGLVGFLLFTLITISFFLKAHRLWLEIPRTHYWHRTFVMGCLGSQIVFHVLGLYQTMIQSVAVMLILTFFLAVINYMNESYSRGIIPDDYSL